LVLLIGQNLTLIPGDTQIKTTTLEKLDPIQQSRFEKSIFFCSVKTLYLHSLLQQLFGTALPDGHILVGLGMENVGILYAIWYILRSYLCFCP
jgi:hypothetical protein